MSKTLGTSSPSAAPWWPVLYLLSYQTRPAHSFDAHVADWMVTTDNEADYYSLGPVCFKNVFYVCVFTSASGLLSCKGLRGSCVTSETAAVTCHSSWHHPASSPVSPPEPLLTCSSRWQSSATSCPSLRYKLRLCYRSSDSPSLMMMMMRRKMKDCSCSRHTSGCLNGQEWHLRSRQTGEKQRTSSATPFVNSVGDYY